MTLRKRARRRKGGLAPSVGAERLEGRVLLSTFVVANTADSGAGSLRQAIEDANANPGPDSIDFGIPGTGPFVIDPSSPLPDVTGPTVIDGYTQPGAAPNTSPDGNNAVILIQLTKSGGFSAAGLRLTGGGSTVRGLAVSLFSFGIHLQGGSGNLLEGNYIGTDTTGTADLGNDIGVYVDASAANTVGGTAAAARNVISGNNSQNLFLVSGSTANLIQGNYVGPDATGTHSLDNFGNGVIALSAPGNTVGGTAAGAGNLISGNAFDGVQLNDASGTVVQGNRIGTDRTGASPVPNGRWGVAAISGTSAVTVGGDAGGANTVAYNNGGGVIVDSGTSVTVLGNAIHDNGGLGIDLGADGVTPNDPGDADGGPNLRQNFPAIASAVTDASGTTVGGTLDSAPNTTFVIRFFASPAADPSGFGEGSVYLGSSVVLTDGAGQATFDATLPAVTPAGQVVTATATDPSGNTSEFSQAAGVIPQGPGTLQFSASGYIAREGDLAVVTVTRTLGDLGEVSVAYATGGGTATPDSDYTPASGVLTFADGETTMTFVVPILDDADVEPLETVALTLSSPTGGATLGARSTAVLNIIDADSPSGLFVTTTADSGPGSLRQAILDANANPGPDTIGFLISSAGPQIISPTSPLPAITEAVTIDGYTQPGSSPNTSPDDNDAVILVGLDGSSAPGADGLTILAGGSTIRGLAIGGFTNAIRIQGPGGNLIAGNFLGLDTAGTSPRGLGNAGVLIEGSTGNTVGGTAAADRNVLASASAAAIWARDGAAGTVALGNLIGTDRTGAARLGNGNGLIIQDSPDAVVGGAAPGARNVISGSGDAGVQINGNASSGAVVQGNYIGTDVTGALALGNNGVGIVIRGATDILIGGPGAGNVISANGGGVGVSGSARIAIQGNLVGTDVTGSQRLGNGGGLGISGASQITLGGTAAGAGNVISGNSGNALELFGDTSGALIQGNRIGTDATGTVALGYASGPHQHGMLLGGTNHTVGGTTAAARNIISGNGGIGIVLAFGSPTNNLIRGNYIGVAANGSSPLGNGRDGIAVQFGAAGNSIGGTAAGAGNVIAYNGVDPSWGGDGVSFQSANGTGNAVLSNSIYANAGLGIDLGDDGVTPNDPGDADTGANNLQNFPVLLSARRVGPLLAISGTIQGLPRTSLRIQLFSDGAADPSGFGEGRRLLGSITVRTNAAGFATFTTLLTPGTNPGQVVTATATDAGGNTSEFSQAVAITQVGSLSLPGRVASAPLSPPSAKSSLAVPLGALALDTAPWRPRRPGRGR